MGRLIPWSEYEANQKKDKRNKELLEEAITKLKEATLLDDIDADEIVGLMEEALTSLEEMEL